MLKTLAMMLLVSLLVFPAMAVNFVDDFDVPENSSGISHDGEFLWIGFIGEDSNKLYSLNDYNGSVNDSIDIPAEGCYGLDWNSNVLWLINSQPQNRAYSLNTSGTVITSWDLPSDNMRGVTISPEGFLYVGSYHQPEFAIYKLDPTTGDSLDVIAAPIAHPSALAWRDTTMWMAGDNGLVYELDMPSGTPVDSFAAPGGDPKGLAFDGEYLYLLDEGEGVGLDKVYRIDPIGVSPRLSLNITEFDFGAVPVNTTSSIDLVVTNTGTAPMEVYSIEFSGNTTGFELVPAHSDVTLQPFEEYTVTLNFHPPVQGQYNTPYIYLTCSDLNHGYVEFPIHAVGGRSTQSFYYLTNENPLDFGTVLVHQTDVMGGRKIYIENRGIPQLEIEDFESTSDDFFITNDFPIIIEGGDVVDIDIWWLPTEAGIIEETLTFWTNDPQNEFYRITAIGAASDETVIGGTEMWLFDIEDEGYPESFTYVAEISDIRGLGFNAVFGLTGDGKYYVLNSNAWQNPNLIFSGEIHLPWEHYPGFNDEVGYHYSAKTADIASDLNGDGFKDIVIGTSGQGDSNNVPDGVLVALDGTTCEILWVFNSLAFGGAPISSVKVISDYNSDSVPEILITLDMNNDQAGPQAVALISGINGAPLWLSQVQGFFRIAAEVDDNNADGINDIVGATTAGEVYGLDGATGYPIWFYDIGDAVTDMQTIVDVTGDDLRDVIVCANNGTFVLDAANGSYVWDIEYINQTTSSEYLGDVAQNGGGVVALGQSNGLVYGVDLYEESVGWQVNLNGTPLDMKYVTDLNNDHIPEVVVGTNAGRVSVIAGNGDDVLWSFTESNNNRQVHCVGMANDIEGNHSVEILSCTRSGKIRMFSGGRDASVIEDNTIITLPDQYSVESTWPNPFNSSVRMKFNIPANSPVKVGIYDVLGRMVDNMTVKPQAGSGEMIWTPGNKLGTGLYFVRMENVQSPVARVIYVK